MKNANYPDWVMKYKTKGVYVNKKGATYYLYKAHSERIKGTNKVRRVSDGYIGRVTEKDGLILAAPKVHGDIIVYKHGIYMFLYQFLSNIHKGFKRKSLRYADTILSVSILKFLDVSLVNYHSCTLQFLYENYNEKLANSSDIKDDVTRCILMINEYISAKLNTDFEVLKEKLELIYLIDINKELHISKIDQELLDFLKLLNIEVIKNGKN